jgi:hypothetical protein
MTEPEMLLYMIQHMRIKKKDVLTQEDLLVLSSLEVWLTDKIMELGNKHKEKDE